MTVMRHKSVDTRRIRRQRYKDACKPIMAKYGCPSTKVAEVVRGIDAESARLAARVRELEETCQALREEVKSLRSNPPH